jgi:hypothetical protein
MLIWPPAVRVFLCTEPTDMRKGFDSLVLYSLTGTCKHLGIDPFAYLRDVLGRLPTQPVDRLGELLPDVWFEAHPQARRKKVA